MIAPLKVDREFGDRVAALCGRIDAAVKRGDPPPEWLHAMQASLTVLRVLRLTTPTSMLAMIERLLNGGEPV